MDSSRLYPLNISLANKNCLIAGFGNVGKRKLDGLLKADATSILILDVNQQPDMSGCPGFVKFEARACTEEDIKNSFLVFAATSSDAENRRISGICQKLRVLCNCVTSPGAGDVQIPAVARSGNLMAAISTAGTSPALARLWKTELCKWLAEQEKQAWLTGRFRSAVLKQNFTQAQNAIIFRQLASLEFGIILKKGNMKEISAWLYRILPESLLPETITILEEYKSAFP